MEETKVKNAIVFLSIVSFMLFLFIVALFVEIDDEKHRIKMLEQLEVQSSTKMKCLEDHLDIHYEKGNMVTFPDQYIKNGSKSYIYYRSEQDIQITR